jgi:hypothetical protein
MPWTKEEVCIVEDVLTSGRFSSVKDARKAIAEEISKPVPERTFYREVVRHFGKRPSAMLQLPSSPFPEGHHIKGVSTLVDSSGRTVMQWFKTAKDRDSRVQTLERVIDRMPEIMQVYAKPVKHPKRRGLRKDLYAVYPIGDPHFGMRSSATTAHEEEDSYSVKDCILSNMDYLVQTGAQTEKALIAILGDLTHINDTTNATPTNKNPLDTDMAYEDLYEFTFAALLRLIHVALTQHAQVRVIVEIGNHDLTTAFTMAIALREHFRDELRVTVDTDKHHYHFDRFGRNLIMTTHGHHKSVGKNPGELFELMAAARKEDWGQTDWRWIYTGHVHMQQRWERLGGSIESFAPAAVQGDAWHHRNGYHAKPRMTKIWLHKDRGEVSRSTIASDIF